MTKNNSKGPAAVATACETEIVDLHRFFVAWMTASVPRSEAEFNRFTDVLDKDFVIVSPRGIITDRSALNRRT